MPTGTTSYLSRSMERRTLAAVEQETACSEERPPKTMATRGRRLGWSGWGWSVVIRRDSIPTFRTPSYADGVVRDGDSQSMQVETFLVASGRPGRSPGASANVPVELTSTYAADGAVNYARSGNPTWNAFEEALGGLEGGRALVHARARELGVTSVVDNTLSTPLLCRPLSLGADVVVHSVTKYLSGHSDVVLGATVVADTERGRAIGDRLRRHRTLHGAIAGPMEVFLALRGLRTLSVRFERASASAAELARRLEGHTAVERVRYPGSGAMVSIDVAGDADAAERVCASMRLWLHSTSLGGVESQVERRRRHPSESEQVPVNLLRLSVGIEHVDDLWADLAQALDRA